MRAALKIGLALLLVAAAIIVFVYRLWAGKKLYASDAVRCTSPRSAKEAAVPALMVVAHPADIWRGRVAGPRLPVARGGGHGCLTPRALCVGSVHGHAFQGV